MYEMSTTSSDTLTIIIEMRGVVEYLHIRPTILSKTTNSQTTTSPNNV